MRGKANFIPNLIPGLYLILIVAWTHGGRRNAKHNWLFFVLVACICAYTVFFTASDDARVDCDLASTAACLAFGASDTILFRNCQPELQKIGQKQSTSDMCLLEELRWSISFVLTPRGVGWMHEPTSQIAPKPKADCFRWNFVTSQLQWLCFYILLTDISSIFIRANPCFSKGGPLFSEYPWFWKATVWLYMSFFIEWTSTAYVFGSIVTVAFGLYRPSDWPHIFGSPRDAYIVRKCWGRIWHQMLRRTLTSHGTLTASALGLPKCQFTTYFKLYISFLVSGGIHAAGDYILHQNSYTGQAIKFFLLQAVAITCEDAVIGIAKRFGYSTVAPLSRIMGYLWVFVWFAFSAPLWLGPNLHAGAAGAAIQNPSIIMGVWKGEWTIAI